MIHNDLDIRFYTKHIQAPAVANFSAILSAPWGQHIIRGRIINSTQPDKHGQPVVVWPKWGELYSNHPAEPAESRTAERIILEAWAEFQGWQR